ncbi:uncharacterized protein LOC128675722 [Plodia interpunctella]|uniref:uncharacterized protein LOC128675722 n=1 Tax=Plodia interpunctella TaxID=58824 RepID=UPI002367F8B0|nr:uncharacterized protein LOC128675722 [Plodia interpunctella]
MNKSESMEQSSSKRQENGDALSGSERPLKKARFAWQVKGKYHLKNDNNDATQPSTSITREQEAAGPSTEAEVASVDLVGNAEQNLEILGDYLLKQDFNTLDSVIADSEKSLLNPSTSISSESLQYPRYVTSYENSSPTSRSFSSANELDLISMSMVQSYSEDQCIARWQAKQMAKGFVDNTINRVLDSWSRPPPVQSMERSTFLALDIAEFINNLPGDNSVENEGILMAISAHGLQNTSSSNSNDSMLPDNNVDDNSNIAPAPEEDTFLSRPCSPTPPAIEPFVRRENEDKTAWPFPKEVDGDVDNELAQFAIYDSSFNENEHSSPVDEYSVDNFSGNHYDFMDTAVSFAILNKGLTTFGNDYG